jgi:MYXO-CTERM domain-containing protein
MGGSVVPGSDDPGGCACSVGNERSATDAAPLLLAAFALLVFRRRRRA